MFGFDQCLITFNMANILAVAFFNLTKIVQLM